MDLEKVLASFKFNRFQQYSCKLHFQLFRSELELTIDLFNNPNKEITEITQETLGEFLRWDSSKLLEIQNGIWQNCLNCHADDRYSFDGGKTWIETKLEANLLEHNIVTKEDALKQSKIAGVYFHNQLGSNIKSLSISCKTTWDSEHGITFTYVDNKLREIA